MNLIFREEKIQNGEYLRQLTLTYRKKYCPEADYNELLADIGFILVKYSLQLSCFRSVRGLFVAIRNKLHTLRETESKERRINRLAGTPRHGQFVVERFYPDSDAEGWESVNVGRGNVDAAFHVDVNGGGRSCWTHAYAEAERKYWTFENVYTRIKRTWKREWLIVLEECIRSGLKCPVKSCVSNRSFVWRRAVFNSFIATWNASWDSYEHRDWIEYIPNFHTYKPALKTFSRQERSKQC